MAEQQDIWASVKERFKKGCLVRVDCGPGWQPLVVKLCAALDKVWEGYDEILTGRECWQILQVKEKMGSLVVHAEISMKSTMSAPAKVVEDHRVRSTNFYSLIDGARVKSAEICEQCGGEGRKRFLIGVFKVLCDRCFIQWEETRNQTA